MAFTAGDPGTQSSADAAQAAAARQEHGRQEPRRAQDPLRRAVGHGDADLRLPPQPRRRAPPVADEVARERHPPALPVHGDAAPPRPPRAQAARGAVPQGEEDGQGREDRRGERAEVGQVSRRVALRLT